MFNVTIGEILSKDSCFAILDKINTFSVLYSSASVSYRTHLFQLNYILGYGLGAARKQTTEGGYIFLLADTILEPQGSC